MFKTTGEVSQRNRRDQNKLCLHCAKATLMQKSILCMAPKIYNKLPDAMKKDKLFLFKKNLKKLLTLRCYYTVNDFLNDKSLC